MSSWTLDKACWANDFSGLSLCMRDWLTSLFEIENLVNQLDK